MRRQYLVRWLLVALLVVLAQIPAPVTPVAHADGFIDFENGLDSQPIRSTIPGLQFTTTEGYDWIYGDWRTGEYNGPYPNGMYYSNGNFFAWLGPNQGAGRIDFTESGANYIQVWVSSAHGLYADAYDGMGRLIATSHVDANLDTGSMLRLRVDAPTGQKIAYVIFHDTGNYWLIDDLSTDAAGVPTQRPPVIVIPGVMGSQLDTYDSSMTQEITVWPPLYNPSTQVVQLTDLPKLNLAPLALAQNGVDSADARYATFSSAVLDHLTIKLGPIIIAEMEPYDRLLARLRESGFRVYEYHYDWRMDVRTPWHSQGYGLPQQDLSDYVNWVLADSGATKVNIVAHSLGGLVTRAYVSASPQNAIKVEQAIILGTPYLGAPETMATIRAGHRWLDTWHLEIPRLSDLLRGLLQNYASVYEIIPSRRYWDVNGGDWYWVNGNAFGWDKVQSFLREKHNRGLVDAATSFHQVVDYWDDLPGQVAFRFIVGSGRLDTIGGLKEQEQPWWLGGTRWDLILTNGDGTVPLVSASLQGNGVNYRGDVPVWYANGVDHGGLTQIDYILDFVVAMLATPPNAQAMARTQHAAPATLGAADLLYRGAASAAMPHQRVTAPPVPPQMSETPFPVDGAQISVFQASALHVYDNAGHHTGPRPDESIELGIPGSSYDVVGPGIFVTVPAGNVYQTQIVPLGDRQFDMRVRDVEGMYTQFIQRTLVYDSVSMGSTDRAFLSVNPTDLGATPTMGVDSTGDGVPDKYVSPTADLNTAQSYDFQPPQVSISVEGARDARGAYIGKVRVTIAADDSGSGVASTRYSIDGGATFQVYTGTFEVFAESNPSIGADVSDRAGNHGTASVRLVPSLSFLPLVQRPTSTQPSATWQETPGLSGRAVLDLTSSSAACNTVFAATDAGVYRSWDGGRNWAWTFAPAAALAAAGPAPAYEGLAEPAAGMATAVAVCPANPNIVYAGGWGSGVYRSSDGGGSWQQRAGGLSDHWIYDLAVAPNNCEVVYAATSSNGVFKTTNGGSAWQGASAGLGNGLTRALAVAPGNPNRVYVGTTAGVYRSDNGAGWWAGTGGLPGVTAWGLAVAPGNADTVYVGLDGRGVYRSWSGGSAWQAVNAGLGDVKARALIMDPLVPSTLYAGRDDGGGVYRSLDSGARWDAFNAGLGNGNVKSLWLDGGSCRSLLAGTTSGAWYYGP